MVNKMEKEKAALGNQLRDLEWRLDQESKVCNFYFFMQQLGFYLKITKLIQYTYNHYHSCLFVI